MQIATGLLGLYDRELVPPHLMPPGTDADRMETDRARQFFSGVRRGTDVSAFATPGLVRHLSAMPHRPAPAPPPEPELTFIARVNVTRPLEMFGSPVARFAFYKMHAGTEDRWLTTLLTVDGRIAAFEGYQTGTYGRPSHSLSCANHFVLSGPDHVSQVAARWRSIFTATVVLLAAIEGLASALAIRLARP